MPRQKRALRKADDGRSYAPISQVEVEEGFNVRTKQPPPDEEMLMSIRSRGIDSPLFVRRKDGSDTLFVLDGHRRYQAALIIGLSEVPVIDYGILSEKDAICTALRANCYRKQMSTADWVYACGKLMKTGTTVREASEVLGLAKSSVAEYFKIATADPSVRSSLKKSAQGRITKKKAVEISRLEPEAQPKAVVAAKSTTPSGVLPRISKVTGDIPGVTTQNLTVLLPGEKKKEEYRMAADYKERCMAMEAQIAQRKPLNPSNKKLLGMELTIAVLRGRMKVEDAFVNWEKV
jgi:ParB/RepB/Spo0J family partition protein